jgi:hypothetical protein
MILGRQVASLVSFYAVYTNQSSKSQRAVIAAQLANIKHGGDRKSENQDANLHLENVSQAEAAEEVV